MKRAFSPWVLRDKFSYGVAIGWYEAGPLALKTRSGLGSGSSRNINKNPVIGTLADKASEEKDSPDKKLKES